MTVDQFVQTMLGGLAIGCIYSLIALGNAGGFLEHADIRMMLIDPGAGEPPLGLHVGPGHVER